MGAAMRSKIFEIYLSFVWQIIYIIYKAVKRYLKIGIDGGGYERVGSAFRQD